MADEQPQDDLDAVDTRFDAIRDRIRSDSAALDLRFDAMSASLDELERLLFPQRSQPKPKPNFTVIEGGSAPS